MRYLVILTALLFTVLFGCDDTAAPDGSGDGISGTAIAETNSGGTVGDVDLNSGEDEEDLLEGE